MKSVRFISMFLVFVLAAGSSGCAVKSRDREIKKYLDKKYSEKYDGGFNYVRSGDSVWSSVTKTLIYSDEEGNEFEVRYVDDVYSDNYCYVLYDDEIQDDVQSVFSIEDNIKIFVSTDFNYFGSTQIFDNYTEYMKECTDFDLEIYITDRNQRDFIVEMLSEYCDDNEVEIQGVAYLIDESEFADVYEHRYYTDKLENYIFDIERDGTISFKNWEE